MGKYDELGNDDFSIYDLINKWFPFHGPYDADSVKNASAAVALLYYYLNQATQPEFAAETLTVDPITSLMFSTSNAVDGMSALVARLQQAFDQIPAETARSMTTGA